MGRLLKPENGISLAGPYIGAPYGVMLLESLVAKGARRIVILGWCGAVTPDLFIGDLIIPDQALCDEGTSRNYQDLDPDLGITLPDEVLSHDLAGYLDKTGTKVHRKSIWTTDAIYRETPGKIAWFRDRGAAAVDMECSALFAAARYRNVQATALLVVSDSLTSREWDPGFRKTKFKKARTHACQSVLSFCDQLASQA